MWQARPQIEIVSPHRRLTLESTGYIFTMDVARKSIARGVVVETVSPTELLQVLNGACSLDQAQIIASGDRLKQMLDMFGIFDSLQDVATRRELPLPIRQQAIIQFTRAAPNHWKSRK